MQLTLESNGLTGLAAHIREAVGRVDNEDGEFNCLAIGICPDGGSEVRDQ
ncbi:MAG: hypothetical protein ACJ70U_03775 [Nitrososphaera sp.]